MAQWQGSFIALIILGISKFCCEYQLLCLRSPSEKSSRLCSWSSSLHSLHHPLITLISDSTRGHHLYADDTQLFISFAASDFSAKIIRLQVTIYLVSNWMSSNLLSLTQAETDYWSKIAEPTLLSSKFGGNFRLNSLHVSSYLFCVEVLFLIHS